MNAQQRLKHRYNWLKANFPKLHYDDQTGWSFDGDWIAGSAVEIDEVIDAAISLGKGTGK